MFTLEFSEAVAQDLADLRAFDRKQILGQIDSHLIHQPTAETRNQKKLIGLDPLGSMRGLFGNFAWVNSGYSTLWMKRRRG
jgi:hypothetical protein